jgi:hypothetical protein
MFMGAMVVCFLMRVPMGVIPILPHTGLWGYGPKGGVGCVMVEYDHQVVPIGNPLFKERCLII